MAGPACGKDRGDRPGASWARSARIRSGRPRWCGPCWSSRTRKLPDGRRSCRWTTAPDLAEHPDAHAHQTIRPAVFTMHTAQWTKTPSSGRGGSRRSGYSSAGRRAGDSAWGLRCGSRPGDSARRSPVAGRPPVRGRESGTQAVNDHGSWGGEISRTSNGRRWKRCYRRVQGRGGRPSGLGGV